MALRNIAWLAGLLEGEAYFCLQSGSPGIRLAMTDLDVVLRATELLGAHSVNPQRQADTAKDSWKPMYRTSVHGAVAAGWMMTIYPFLGARRREKIREILADWRSRKKRPMRRA